MRDWEQAFLDDLAENGNVTNAAAAARVSRQTAYDYREIDLDFRGRWEEALERGVAALEIEARRRALHGTNKPVYYLGKQVGEIREYSDTLTIFLLKAHRPDTYCENTTTRHEGGLVVRFAKLDDEALEAEIEKLGGSE